MTLQEIFDKVATHLLTQNKKAQGPRDPSCTTPPAQPPCLYRAPDGSKCAVGCLIPDDLYDPAMEGDSFSESALWGEVIRHLRVPADQHDDLENLLITLQEVHDHSKPEEWATDLEFIAHEHRLTRPPLLKERLEHVR